VFGCECNIKSLSIEKKDEILVELFRCSSGTKTSSQLQDRVDRLESALSDIISTAEMA